MLMFRTWFRQLPAQLFGAKSTSKTTSRKPRSVNLRIEDLERRDLLSATGVMSATGVLNTEVIQPTTPAVVSFGAPSTGTLAELGVSAPATVTPGQMFEVTVSAEDAKGNTLTTYNGTASYTYDWLSSVFEGAYMGASSPLQLTDGVGYVWLRAESVGTATFDASLGSASGGARITIIAGPTAQIDLIAPASVTAGAAFPVTVRAFDAAGDPTNATVTFSASDGQSVQVSPTLFTVTNGVGTGTITLNTADNLRLTAADGSIQAVSVISMPSLGALTKQPTANQAYSSTITVSGGTGGYHNLSVSGLPTGLSASLSGGTITLSGTTPTAGTFGNITMSVLDSNGAKASATYTLTVAPASSLTLTPGSLPVETAGQSYTAVLGATGGYGKYTFKEIGGALPVGLSLSPSGALTGAPKVAGTYTFTVQIKDTSSASLTGTEACSLTVIPAAVTQFAVSAPLSTVAGNRFVVLVQVFDAFRNGYNGTVTINCDGQSRSVSITNGQGSTNLTLTTAHTATITATEYLDASFSARDILIGKTTSTNIVVDPGAPASISFSGLLISLTVGQPWTLTAKVTDTYGNLCSGNVTFGLGSGDTCTLKNFVPTSPPLIGGQASVVVTPNNAGVIVLTATAGSTTSRAAIAVHAPTPSPAPSSTLSVYTFTLIAHNPDGTVMSDVPGITYVYKVPLQKSYFAQYEVNIETGYIDQLLSQLEIAGYDVEFNRIDCDVSVS
jgi:large repetitive protein